MQEREKCSKATLTERVNQMPGEAGSVGEEGLLRGEDNSGSGLDGYA